jgi:hypothetical protein
MLYDEIFVTFQKFTQIELMNVRMYNV